MCGFHGNEEFLGYCSSCFKHADSAFLRAVLGAAQDKVEVIYKFFAEGGTIHRVITEEEMNILRNKLSLAVDFGASLADVASRYGSDQVLFALLEMKEKEFKEVPHLPLSNLVDDFTPIGSSQCALGAVVRKVLLDTRQTRDDGLIHFDTCFAIRPSALPSPPPPLPPHNMRVGKSFAFPLQALSSPLSFFDKKHPLFPYVEVPSRKKEIEEATSFITSLPLSSCRPLLPIYTPADLNCLLHGLMIGINGVKDGVFAEKEEEKVDSSSRTILRDALYDNLHSCEALISRIAPTADRMLELLKDASQGKQSLDGGHVFALANILRRPIIMYSSRGVEGEIRDHLAVPFRVSGIYLPLLWSHEETVKDPIAMCYSIGHFSVLVGFVDPEAPDLLSFPLCDEKLIPLPVHFLEGEGEEEKKEEGKEAEGGEGEGRKDVFKVGGGSRRRIEALKKYVRNYQVVEMEREGGKGEKVLVEVCDQLHPLGEWVPVGESPVYFDSFEGMRENLCQLLNPDDYCMFMRMLREAIAAKLFDDPMDDEDDGASSSAPSDAPSDVSSNSSSPSSAPSHTPSDAPSDVPSDVPPNSSSPSDTPSPTQSPSPSNPPESSSNSSSPPSSPTLAVSPSSSLRAPPSN